METKEEGERGTGAGKVPFFTPREVAAHNRPNDCWVSVNHRVLDVTDLVQENLGVLVQPIIKHAGEDISHWFDPDTEDVKYHVDPERGVEMPFVPYGRFLHVAPPEPTASWRTEGLLPWWRDPKYVVGKLTHKVRWLELVNVLTQQRHNLEVCAEETLEDIQARYLSKFNSHAGSYTWKHLDDDDFVPLDMSKTLDENGIPDESPLLEELDMDEHQYKPIIYLYYNDDLTIL